MTHLSEDTLNELLDDVLTPALREQADVHLAACPACAERLAQLRTLFADLEALPDAALDVDLAPAVAVRLEKRPLASLPRPVWWLAAAQVAAVTLAAIFSWPLVKAALPLGLAPTLPTLAELAAPILAVLNDWELGLRAPVLSFELPALDLPTTTLVLSAAGLALFWLVGNGILLLPRSRR